ncbi:hypothetical protein J6590_062635 [Homalodisca vitripennis]|nr:hypothetical protein J6590_062635 [Homalodisca vitripennis]
MSFSCIVKGSFRQGDEQLFPTSKNVQCTANSACGLVWKALGFEFYSIAIDTILIAGEFSIQGQTVDVEENIFVHDALYPVTEEDVSESVISLSNVLEFLMAVELQNIGFLFAGQTVTVRSQEQLHLFDPHPVNENRTHDLANDINKLARLFQCDTFPALASLLLLFNAALDGSVRQYSITRLTFRSSTFSENIQNLTMHETASNSTTKPKAFEIPKEIKPGLPKILKTTREEATVRCYEDRHSGSGQDRVQVFRQMNPKVSEFRHLPNSIARNIVAQGPMAHWSNDIFVCPHCEAHLFEKEKDRKNGVVVKSPRYGIIQLVVCQHFPTPVSSESCYPHERPATLYGIIILLVCQHCRTPVSSESCCPHERPATLLRTTVRHHPISSLSTLSYSSEFRAPRYGIIQLVVCQHCPTPVSSESCYPHERPATLLRTTVRHHPISSLSTLSYSSEFRAPRYGIIQLVVCQHCPTPVSSESCCPHERPATLLLNAPSSHYHQQTNTPPPRATTKNKLTRHHGTASSISSLSTLSYSSEFESCCPHDDSNLVT